MRDIRKFLFEPIENPGNAMEYCERHDQKGKVAQKVAVQSVKKQDWQVRGVECAILTMKKEDRISYHYGGTRYVRLASIRTTWFFHHL